MRIIYLNQHSIDFFFFRGGGGGGGGGGAQWLIGRVLDSRPRGHGFEPHRRHCVVVLEQDTLSLLSTGSSQEVPSLFN